MRRVSGALRSEAAVRVVLNRLDRWQAGDPYNTTGGRDCVKSLRLCLHETEFLNRLDRWQAAEDAAGCRVSCGSGCRVCCGWF